ncbi:MAG: FtsW/RodA/SpoVE family cell cycle protein [Lachnospiraceae bacterium]|nr:FtsW/RodA/SpoVE family cell cycle protein [Lachnospiraceae bacterium]
MSLYLTEAARIGGGVLMAVYALLSFLVFIYRTEKKRMVFYVLQAITMVLIQFCLFMQMLIKTGDMRYMFFFAFQAIVLIATIVMHKLIYPDGNMLIMNNICLLLMVSMAILTRLSGNRAIRQFIVVALSLILALCIPAIVHRLTFLRDIWWIYATVGIAMLAFVLILGRAVNGSNINYSVGGLSFQPSEFVKILFVFFVAASLAKAEKLTQILGICVLAALHVIILVFSRDLGAGLIYYVVFFFMLYIARDRLEYLFICAVMGTMACLLAYRMFTHVRTRVAAFIDPWSKIDGAGYQVAQSLFGISVGGPFGLGLYGGAPDAIPFAEQDFIFSAICEELGIVFAVSLLAICLSTCLMMLWVSERIRDPFYRTLCSGFAVVYIFQVFLTVGGGVKFIPLTGVTLPLVSYGGSSVLSTIIMFGIFQGAVLIRADEHRDAARRLKHRLIKDKNRPSSETDDEDTDAEEFSDEEE